MALTVRRFNGTTLGLFIGGIALGLGGPAQAQQAISVSMVQQDFSDCTNTTVKDNGGGAPGGTVWMVRNGDSSISVKVGISATPLTSYNFFLKCVRQLGTIQTDEDGTGEAAFTIPPNTAPTPFAFDMYPNGAPAGNKFQSVTAQFK